MCTLAFYYTTYTTSTWPAVSKTFFNPQLWYCLRRNSNSFTFSGVVPLRKRSQNQTTAFLNPKGENYENKIIQCHHTVSCENKSMSSYNVILFHTKIRSFCFKWKLDHTMPSYRCNAISCSTYLFQVQRKQDLKTILRTKYFWPIHNLYYILPSYCFWHFVEKYTRATYLIVERKGLELA